MEAFPTLPPELGTAVIFSPRHTPVALAAEPPSVANIVSTTIAQTEAAAETQAELATETQQPSVVIAPPDPRYIALGLQTPATALTEQILARLSPSTLFAETVVALLDPTTRSLGPIYLSQLQGAVLGAPLPIGESILIAWPQTVGMIASAILLFVIGYVIFQRQEVRA